jgi:hypothetical protein
MVNFEQRAALVHIPNPSLSGDLNPVEFVTWTVGQRNVYGRLALDQRRHDHGLDRENPLPMIH